MRTARVRVRPKLSVVENQLPVKGEGYRAFVKELFDLAEDYGVKSFGVIVEHVDNSTSSGYSIGHDGSRVKMMGACHRLLNKLQKDLDD